MKLGKVSGASVGRHGSLPGSTTPTGRHNGLPSGTLLDLKACMVDSFALEMLPELVLDAGFFVLVLNFIFTSFLCLFLASLILGYK
ncbi:hypothetical protein Tco_0111951 [Tanacetum coccineum]